MRSLRSIGPGAFWVVALSTPHLGGAQVAPRDSVRATASRLFARISGKWSCKGGFPRGGTLEADLAFTPGLGGAVLSFEHVDRAPGMYWQRSTWALDAKLPKIVSVGLAGSQKDMSGAPVGFSSTALTDTSITLQADTLAAPPFATNRFTYFSRQHQSLEMRWEVLRNAAWSLGDSLVCGRVNG